MSQKKEFPSWPVFAPDVIAAAERVLESGRVNYWTGSEVQEFEKEYAAFIGTKYAVAVANGTVALEIALRAAGIGDGHEVVVAPRTFVASAGAVLLAGARPVFCDVDRTSGNIAAHTIEPVLTKKTRAIIPVHMAGLPCEMDPIMELAKKRGIVVIEDCAQAHGAKYKGKTVGSFGLINAHSFCQDKIMTTGGEGGMITTDDEDLWKKAWSYKDHGKGYDTVFHKKHKPGFRWLHESVGTNGRLTEIQAAIGRVALKKIPEWVKTRRRNADLFNSRFSRHRALEVQVPGQEFFHSYYKYYVNLRPGQIKKGWDRDRIMNEATGRGAPCFSGTCCEIYREKVFVDLRLTPKKRFAGAKFLADNALMFLVHPTLGPEHIGAVADIIDEILVEAEA